MTDLFKTTNDVDSGDNLEVDENVDYLAELVGEGKKFKTVNDLARGKAQADAFIERLKQEQAALRQDLSGKLSLEEFLDKLETKTSKPLEATKPVTQTPEQNPQANPNNLTPEKLEEILSKREREATERANLEFVASTLRDKFGPNFQKSVNAKAEELGIGTETLAQIAKERPQAFLKLIGASEATEKTPEPTIASFIPKSNVNSQTFKGTNPKMPKKFSDFEKMRKESARQYWQPDVQKQLYKLTEEFGEDFLNS